MTRPSISLTQLTRGSLMNKKVPPAVSAALIIVVVVGMGWIAWTRAQPRAQSDVRPIVQEILKQNPNLPPIDPGNDMVMMGSRPGKAPKTKDSAESKTR